MVTNVIKVIGSRTAPNPIEIDYWVDTGTNPYGADIKYHNGIDWVNLFKSGNSEIDLSNYYTKHQVDSKLIAKADTSAVNDLFSTLNDTKADKTSTYTKSEINTLFLNFDPFDESKYYTKVEIDTKGYLTDIPAVYITEDELSAFTYNKETIDSTLATKKYVDDQIKNIEYPSVDLTDYATKTYVTDEIAKAALGGEVDLTGYATEEWVEGKGYLTEHQDISHLASKDYVDIGIADLVDGAPETLNTLNEISEALKENEDVVSALDKAIGSKADKTSLEGLATEEFVKEQINAIEHPTVDLTGYATEEWVEAEIAKIEPGSNIDVSILATKTELENVETKIPTDSTIASWGYTKNTGTYSKPSDGIPVSDLSEDIQNLLEKANNSLQDVPMASSEEYGGVIANEKTSDYTTEVKIDSSTGILYIPEINQISPDEEDVTVDTIGEEKILKFKDKEYDKDSYSGLGRKYLRKNIIDGVNVLTQQMFSYSDTRYIIQYDYDLNGNTIMIPTDCVLDFKGGSFRNGTLKLDNTTIKSKHVAFYEINIIGIVFNSIIESGWFNFTGEYENDTPIFLNLINLPKHIHFSSGTYAVELSENIMTVGCNLIGIGGNTIRPVLKIKNSDQDSRFLLGLSYNCGIQNMYLSCYHDNRVLDILRSDVYFGSTGTGQADRRIVLKDLSICYDRYWDFSTEERKVMYSTAIHFRHTDSKIYEQNDKISNSISEGFSFRGSNFDNIQIKRFHEGIKITSGYNSTKMWINSIYFRNLEIWAGKGISFVHDETCLNKRLPYKVNVFSYMFQAIDDENPDLTLGTSYYYVGGFWGNVDRLLILNYDYWDTDCRGVVSGTIYQSNVAGIFNKNKAITGGWQPLDSENPPIIYDWRDMDGDSAISSKYTKSPYIRSVISPEWDGFSIRPAVDFTDLYKNPTSLEENVYGKVFKNSTEGYLEGVFDTDPYRLYKKEIINKENSQIIYTSPLSVKISGKNIYSVPKTFNDISNETISDKEGIVYDNVTRQYYIIHNNVLSDFKGSKKVMYNNYDSENNFSDKFPTFEYDDLNRIFSIAKHPHIIDETNTYSDESSYGPRRLETSPLGVWHKGTTLPSGLTNNTDVGFFFYNTWGNYNKPMWWNGTEFVLADGSYINSYKYGSSFPIGKLADGFMFYHTSHSQLYIAKVSYPDGTYTVEWVGTDGFGIGNRKGESNKRPNLTSSDIGFMYYDTTLLKPIWWNGSQWIDALGTNI